MINNKAHVIQLVGMASCAKLFTRSCTVLHPFYKILATPPKPFLLHYFYLQVLAAEQLQLWNVFVLVTTWTFSHHVHVWETYMTLCKLGSDELKFISLTLQLAGQGEEDFQLYASCSSHSWCLGSSPCSLRRASCPSHSWSISDVSVVHYDGLLIPSTFFWHLGNSPLLTKKHG